MIYSRYPRPSSHKSDLSETTGGRLTLDLIHIDGCLERIGEDDPEEERLFRDLWEDPTQREVVVEILQADCDVRTGRPREY